LEHGCNEILIQKLCKAITELPNDSGVNKVKDKQSRVTYWVPSKLNHCMNSDNKEYYWVTKVYQGHNLPDTSDRRNLARVVAIQTNMV
jgi:hypothetical protein